MIRKSFFDFKSRIRPLSGHCSKGLVTSPRGFFDPDSPETRAEWVFAPPSEFGSPARYQSSHRRTETKPFPPIRPPRALTTTLSLIGASQCCKHVWFSLKDPSVCAPLYIPRTRFWVKDCSCTCNIPNYNHRTDWGLLQPLASQY